MIRRARENGDHDLALELRRLDVIAEALLRARGELPERHARHYWTTLAATCRALPQLAAHLQADRASISSGRASADVLELAPASSPPKEERR